MYGPLIYAANTAPVIRCYKWNPVKYDDLY